MLTDNIPGKGNVILVFSDPAGAKACLALASILQAQGYRGNITAYSNKAHAFYQDWKVPVIVLPTLLIKDLPEKPDWIFTGTSHPESSMRFEVSVIEQAYTQNIPCYSFIDHWTLLSLRFSKECGEPVYPDHIFVLDERAKTLAIKEGLPAMKISIAGNPYLDYISSYWKPEMGKEAIRECFGLSAQTPILLYAPDPLSLRNDQAIYGFNEADVLDDILSITNSLNVAILVKPHPLQPAGKLEPVIDKYKECQVHIVPSGIDNLDLIAASELIIGFYSNFLIEANIINSNIIRYFPNAAALDSISHLDIGEKITSYAHLQKAITNKIVTNGTNSVFNIRTALSEAARSK